MNKFALIAGTVMAGVCAFGQTSTTTTTTTTNLPSLGIGTMETAQIILTNTANVSMLAGAVLPSCSGSVAFFSSTGTQIGSSMSFTVGSNQIAAVNLPYTSAASISSRALVRPVISVTTTRPNAAPCTLSYSLVTFDSATGVTHALISQGPVNGLSIIPIHFGN